MASIQCIRDEVRRRRKEHKLDYRTVVARTVHYLYQQGCDETEITIVSEEWLKRLEIGRPANTTPNILDALFRALEYTDHERVNWLLRASYSPLGDSTSADNRVAEVINYVTYLLYKHPLAAALIASATADAEADNLTEDEMLEIVAKSLDLVLQHRRR